MELRTLGRRLRGGLVFGARGATLALLVLSGRYQLFLRPEFGWLLALGAVIAVGFLAAAVRSSVPLPLSRTLILLLPLLHLAASDPASVGKDMFANRFLGVQVIASGPTESSFPRSAPETGAMSSDVASGGADSRSVPEGGNADNEMVPDEAISQGFAGQEPGPVSTEPSLTILQLLRAPEKRTGSVVRLLGLLHRDARLESHFGPGRDVALYRFVIACCAADALPVTVALEGEIPELDAEQWVEIEGRFDLTPHGNSTVPLIRVLRVFPVDPPAVPFLF